MRRWARRIATRRSPGPTSGSEHGLTSPRPRFWGRHLVRTVAHGRHHGKGQHHQRDMPVPTMPGAGLVVSKPELGLGRLERVLDGPAPPLDAYQRRDPGPGRAPGREEGKLAITEVAADQEAARPR